MSIVVKLGFDGTEKDFRDAITSNDEYFDFFDNLFFEMDNNDGNAVHHTEYGDINITIERKGDEVNMNRKIKVGDTVKVVDWGCEYSTNDAWFYEHKNELELEWLLKYSYGNDANFMEHRYDDDSSYQVLYVDEIEEKCLITFKSFFEDINEVYLIGFNGIKLNNKATKMTISEIEEKLGIRNLEIIEED